MTPLLVCLRGGATVTKIQWWNENSIELVGGVEGVPPHLLRKTAKRKGTRPRLRPAMTSLTLFVVSMLTRRYGYADHNLSSCVVAPYFAGPATTLLYRMNTKEDLRALQAHQMKDILTENNISFAECFDESEILQNVEELWFAERKPKQVRTPALVLLIGYLTSVHW